MDRAKIALSEQERRLVMDPSVILTKNAVIAKVYTMFGDLATETSGRLQLPPEVVVIPPKISRGEAYQGLPYVMLDFPRFFSGKDVLAIRTFFWWGHFMSVTLQLKGGYARLYERLMMVNFQKLAAAGAMLAIGEEEWNHDLESSQYVPMGEADCNVIADRISTGKFVKIGLKFPLSEWDELPVRLRETHELLGSMIDLMGD